MPIQSTHQNQRFIGVNVQGWASTNSESVRAAHSFGARRVSITADVDRRYQEHCRALQARYAIPIGIVRVEKNDAIRKGLLPLVNKTRGGNSRVNRHKMSRLGHRILAWFDKAGSYVGNKLHGRQTQLSVIGPYAETLSGIRNPPPAINQGFGNTQMPPRGPKQTVDASDQDLARMLQYGHNQENGPAFAVTEFRAGSCQQGAESLFGDKGPQISDIRQSDTRQTCHFLCNLSAILRRPDGAQRIQNIMKDNGDGTVTVRFSDRDVRVSKDRIVNNAGRDLFNLGASWVRIMEKAFLGYLAAKHGNTNDLSRVNAKSFNGSKHMERFDHNTPIVAQEALANTMCEKPQQCAALGDDGRTVTCGRDLKTKTYRKHNQQGVEISPDAMYAQIEETLTNNGNVYLGVVPPPSGRLGTLSQLLQMAGLWMRRVVPRHQYNVLAVSKNTITDSKGNQQVVKGYWVSNSYKSKADGVSADDVGDLRGNEVTIADGQRGSSSQFFISQEDFAQLFAEVIQVTLNKQSADANPSDDPTSLLANNSKPQEEPNDQELSLSEGDLEDDFELL